MEQPQFANPKLGAVLSVEEVGARFSRPYRVTLEVLSLVVLIGGLHVCYLVYRLLGGVAIGLVAAALAGSLVYFYVLMRKAIGKLSPQATARFLSDPRDPILYLRPFYFDDRHSERTDSLKPEELLEFAVKEVGPLITVGNPEDRDSPLGALRIYLKHGEWESRVKDLMLVSRFVVFDAWTTHGLEKELSIAINSLAPERMLFSFLSWEQDAGPARQSFYQSFCKELDKIFQAQGRGVSFPERINRAIFMYFDRSRRATLIEGYDFDRDQFNVTSKSGIRRALHPYFIQLGVGLKS